MTYQPAALSREVYRKFIEESGIKDSITEILYRIWEQDEKPAYLDHYVRENFGGRRENTPNASQLKQDLETFERVVKHLKKENSKLETMLAIYEGNPTSCKQPEPPLEPWAWGSRPSSSSSSLETGDEEQVRVLVKMPNNKKKL